MTQVRKKHNDRNTAIGEVKRDPQIYGKNEVKTSGEEIFAALEVVNAKEDWVKNITPETTDDAALKAADDASKAKTKAETAYNTFSTWMENQNVRKQTDYVKAAEAINLGYVKSAQFNRIETYETRRDRIEAKGDFGGEYKEDTAKNKWVLHVHRDIEGNLKVAHTKPTSLDVLNKPIDEKAFKDLNELGIKNPDATRTDK